MASAPSPSHQPKPVFAADGITAPHGGKLINLQVPANEWKSVIESCNKTVEASDRNACDVELLSVG